MTDEETMKTSEITARLQHASPAVTRDWIRTRKLEVKSRDKHTGEKEYSRRQVEEKIAEMPRGPYDKGRPPAEEPPRDHHRGLPADPE